MLREDRTAAMWKMSLKRPAAGGESCKTGFFYFIGETSKAGFFFRTKCQKVSAF